MALFLNDTDTVAKLIRLIEEADQFLYLISPYIRLHHKVEDALYTKKSEKNLELRVLFGKNPENPGRSMTEEQADFFADFPNVEIRYAEHLHAKVYASEDAALITSMNLYDYSQDMNIEAGVMLLSSAHNTRNNVFGTDTDDLAYNDAIRHFRNVINRSILIYDSKKTKGKSAAGSGFCIRTGASIPFNLAQPMSYKSWQSWAQFSNPDYPEKYCHKTGKPSHGKTSMRKPVL